MISRPKSGTETINWNGIDKVEVIEREYDFLVRIWVDGENACAKFNVRASESDGVIRSKLLFALEKLGKTQTGFAGLHSKEEMQARVDILEKIKRMIDQFSKIDERVSLK